MASPALVPWAGTDAEDFEDKRRRVDRMAAIPVVQRPGAPAPIETDPESDDDERMPDLKPESDDDEPRLASHFYAWLDHDDDSDDDGDSAELPQQTDGTPLEGIHHLDSG